MRLGIVLSLTATGVECDSGTTVSRMLLIRRVGSLEAPCLRIKETGGSWKASSKSRSSSSVFIPSPMSSTISPLASTSRLLTELSREESSTWLWESLPPVVGVWPRACRNGGIMAATDFDLSRILTPGVGLSSVSGSFSTSSMGSKNFLRSFVPYTGSETTLLFVWPARTRGGIDVDGPAAKTTSREQS